MRRFIPSAVLIALLILTWEAMVRLLQIPKFILPAPSRVAEALYNTADLLLEHSTQTLTEALLGFFLAIMVGVVLALLMDLLPGLKNALYPLLVISQTIPIIAIAPLLVIWLGYEMLPKVAVVALVCFFPVTVSLSQGLDSADQDLQRLLLGMGATPWQILKIVKFPGAMPSFFAGLKIAATYSIMGAVIGEWLGASKGLGIYMTRSMHSFLTERVFAVIVVISILSLILFVIIEVLGRFLMPWNYGDNVNRE